MRSAPPAARCIRAVAPAESAVPQRRESRHHDKMNITSHYEGLYHDLPPADIVCERKKTLHKAEWVQANTTQELLHQLPHTMPSSTLR